MAIVSLMTGKTTINCSFCQKNIRQLIVLLLRISKQENRSYESKGRYHVKLPLKEKHDILPDHYDLSLARLDSQVKRLRQKPKAKVYLRNTIRYLKSN
jgi:hypothetical protein